MPTSEFSNEFLHGRMEGALSDYSMHFDDNTDASTREDILVAEGRRYAEMTLRHQGRGLPRESLIKLCLRYRDGSIVGPDFLRAANRRRRRQLRLQRS